MALLENLFLDAKFQKKKQKIKMNVLKANENRISKKRIEKIIIMGRAQKQIKQQTEEWLDER